MLFISPVMITILTGMAQPVRAHLTYALVFAEYLFLMCALLPKLLRKRGRLSGAARLFVMGLSLAVSWRKLVYTNELLETAHEVYVADNLMANRIYSAVSQTAGYENLAECKVAFVGARGAQLAGNPTYGDVIGHSVFQWDAGSETGVSVRVCEYFETLGLPMGQPSAADYEKAVEAGKNRPAWPKEGSVFKLDDMVVVKLSR